MCCIRDLNKWGICFQRWHSVFCMMFVVWYLFYFALLNNHRFFQLTDTYFWTTSVRQICSSVVRVNTRYKEKSKKGNSSSSYSTILRDWNMTIGKVSRKDKNTWMFSIINKSFLGWSKICLSTHCPAKLNPKMLTNLLQIKGKCMSEKYKILIKNKT